MAYFAPYIDAAGLHIPSYLDIREELIQEFKNIYGQDIYLDNDSQDYQLITTFALMQYDTMQLLQAIYNNRGPKTAVGTSLDGIVKLNGIRRKAPGYSTCVVELTGDAGTIITNGIAQDEAGNNWSLPTVVAINDSPHILAVVCETLGSIEAMPGTINKIATPTKGWVSVTNKVAAVPGQPIETDEQLRTRQTISTMLPAQALVDSTKGAIADISGVTRYEVYENDTDQKDVNGLPPHSTCAVVEGGLDEAIAGAIYRRKTPGCYTYGDIIVNVADESGISIPIRFFRPTYKTIDVKIKIKALPGFLSTVKQEIKLNTEEYLRKLGIGQDIRYSSIWGVALKSVVSFEKPIFSILEVTVAFEGDTLLVQDLKILFNELPQVGIVTVEVA